ncbi:L-rhamnose isomerase [Membranihabitans marinus]|uniref:L-rhamnose isomerase n=1 Tax=Membranihabitans marinus TaxID=1227546 RepID=UPI001F001A16|nr:L-rhamnose isomerase [Membranihabitans marinus]
MRIGQHTIEAFNEGEIQEHQRSFSFLKEQLERQGFDVERILTQLAELQIAIPTWALGQGGTRFGRFSIGGQPRNLNEKIADIGLIHQLTQVAGRLSLHIPWDIPSQPEESKKLADNYGLAFDAVNSNTFQDQSDQLHSYKHGSLSHVDEAVRRQAIDHNKEVIDYGKMLGSKSLTVWLADGSNHPGQSNLRTALLNTLDSLRQIYDYMPEDWQLFIEYKPFEPYFYSTVIPDWGTSMYLANALGHRAFTLVDLGHHLPNTNIEQIVSNLITFGKLGGFHFNDSKYADDDVSVGSIKPYQLFLIFSEIVQGMANNIGHNPAIAYMIDASHNIKDPILDLIQSLDQIAIAYIKASIIDYKALNEVQLENDSVQAAEILNNAFSFDVRPLLREYRLRNRAPLDAVAFYRQQNIRKLWIEDRGSVVESSGL